MHFTRNRVQMILVEWLAGDRMLKRMGVLLPQCTTSNTTTAEVVEERTTNAAVVPKTIVTTSFLAKAALSPNSRKATTAKPATRAAKLPRDLSCSALSSTSRRFFSMNLPQITRALSKDLCSRSCRRHCFWVFLHYPYIRLRLRRKVAHFYKFYHYELSGHNCHSAAAL